MQVITVKNKLTGETQEVARVRAVGDALICLQALKDADNSDNHEYTMADAKDVLKLEAAAAILSHTDESDISLTTAIELIETHAVDNPHDFIDEVDQIIVWQPLEYFYTCEQFLEAIN